MERNEWLELIEANKSSIMDQMKEAEEAALRYPTCEYRVYISTNGLAGREEWPANASGYYQFRDGYERCYLRTFCHEYYDVLWDYWFSDPSEAAETFKAHFGYALDEDDGRSLREDMRCTVLAHGGTEEEFSHWLEEMTDDAVKESLSNTDFAEMFYDAVDELGG